jgi:hypothetical protein
MAITKISPDLVDFDSALVVSPTLTIGDATAEDTAIVFDGNAQDFYIGLDDSADDLIIGLGSTVGTTPIISVDENKDVAIPDGGLTITVSDNTDNLSLVSTDTDDNPGPNIRLYRNSANPDVNDLLGKIDFEGRNDNSEDILYASISGKIMDETDGTEDANLRFWTIAAGTETETLTLSSGNVGAGTTAPLLRMTSVDSGTGSLPTDGTVGVTGSNANILIGGHNESNSATYSGIALETRTSGASRWLIANEWKSTYLGDLVFDRRTGGSTSAPAMRIDSSGRVLIGGIAATSADTLYGGVVPTLQVEGTGAHDSAIGIFRNSNDGSGPTLSIGKSRGTAVNSDTIVQSGDYTGTIAFTGADGGERMRATAAIKSSVDGTPGDNDMPGRLTFWTTPDGAYDEVERMRIQNSGITQFFTGDGNSGIAEFHTNSSSGSVSGYISIRPQGTARGYIGNGTSLLSGAADSDFIVRGEVFTMLNSGGNAQVLTLTDTADLTLNGNPRSTSYINGKLATNINTTRRVAFYSNGNMDATFRAQGSNSCYLGIMAGATRLSNDASYLWFGGNTDANGGSWSAYIKHITGDNHAKGKLKFLTCDGSLWYNALEVTNTGTDKVLTNSGDVGTISDQRLKKNIQDLTYSLDTFKDLKPRTFEWINPSEHEAGTVNGFIAQELPDPYKYGYQVEETNTIDQGEKVDNPDYDLVKDTNGEAFAGKLGQSDAMYVSIIQQLITKVETLEAEVKALKEA